jgi:hypothetical protein
MNVPKFIIHNSPFIILFIYSWLLPEKGATINKFRKKNPEK